jgi:hypothetical protein
MKFLPEKNTIKKIVPYALGTLAVGAGVGLSYFGFINQIPASAFTDAQLATAANLGTYGTALVGTATKIATFSAAQLAVATGYGVGFVAAVSGSVFAAFKLAQFIVQQCTKFVKSTKKAPEIAPEKNLSQEGVPSASKRSCHWLRDVTNKFAALIVAKPVAVAPQSKKTYTPASQSKRLPSSEFTKTNIVDAPRIRTPRKIHNVA